MIPVVLVTFLQILALLQYKSVRPSDLPNLHNPYMPVSLCSICSCVHYVISLGDGWTVWTYSISACDDCKICLHKLELVMSLDQNFPIRRAPESRSRSCI